MSFAPHQQRVAKEFDELKIKTEALDKFISSASFNEIVDDTEERTRLRHQSVVMEQYLEILQERIENFK